MLVEMRNYLIEFFGFPLVKFLDAMPRIYVLLYLYFILWYSCIYDCLSFFDVLFLEGNVIASAYLLFFILTNNNYRFVGDVPIWFHFLIHRWVLYINDVISRDPLCLNFCAFITCHSIMWFFFFGLGPIIFCS